MSDTKKRPHRFTLPCEACEGEGQRDDAPESRGESWSPVWTGGGDFSRACEAHGCDDGRVPCALCAGAGVVPIPIDRSPPIAPWPSDQSALFGALTDGRDPSPLPRDDDEDDDEDTIECPECSGDCDAQCEACDGAGSVEDTCQCGREFSDDSTAYVGDGEILCRRCVDLTCPDCGGDGEIPLPAEIVTPGARIPEARYWQIVDRSCSMCAGRPHNHDEHLPSGSLGYISNRNTYGYTGVVVRAGLCDRDGVYYAALCFGDGPDDPDACLTMVLEQQNAVPEERADRLAVLRDVMPGEWADGIESEMADTL